MVHTSHALGHHEIGYRQEQGCLHERYEVDFYSHIELWCAF